MSQADPRVPLDDLLAYREWVRALARRLVGDASRADDVERAAIDRSAVAQALVECELLHIRRKRFAPTKSMRIPADIER